MKEINVKLTTEEINSLCSIICSDYSRMEYSYQHGMIDKELKTLLENRNSALFNKLYEYVKQH